MKADGKTLEQLKEMMWGYACEDNPGGEWGFVSTHLGGFIYCFVFQAFFKSSRSSCNFKAVGFTAAQNVRFPCVCVTGCLKVQ